jgi:mannose PTS system EIIC component
MIFESLLAGALGGLLSLDRFQAFQVMVSRPLVAGPLVGWMLGDLGAGLASGVIFEMLWLRTLPIGGFVPPDGTLATVGTAAVSALVRLHSPLTTPCAVCLTFLLLFPLAWLGTRIDLRLRQELGRLARRTEAALRSDSDASVSPYLIAALAMGFTATFLVLTPIVYGAATALAYIAPLLPDSLTKALGIAFYAVPVLAVADMMVRLDEVQDRVLFVLGFVASFCLVLAVH